MKIFSDGKESLELYYLSSTNQLFESIVEQVEWKQNSIRVFGKEYLEPRLTEWFGPPYKYSSIQWPEKELPECLLGLREEIEKMAGVSFNSVLLNYYRNGQDSMGWHSDDEPEMDGTIIASVSFGAPRTIRFRHKQTKKTFNVELLHGSVLLMHNFQENWQHAIPKRTQLNASRLNLTFRKIIQ